MKKITIILLGFTLLVGTACKKDKDSTPSVGTPTKVCLITKDSSSDGDFTNYFYNSSKQLTSTVAYGPLDTSGILSTYTYLGNKVTITNNRQLFQTVVCYLNANGLADSVNFYGLAVFVFKYNSAREPIETTMNRDLNGTPIKEINTYQWSNGNMVKSLDHRTDIGETNYEYYLDKINLSSKSEGAGQFYKTSKNLVKKATLSDGSFYNYTYEFDASGKVTKKTIHINSTHFDTSQITWTCK